MGNLAQRIHQICASFVKRDSLWFIESTDHIDIPQRTSKGRTKVSYILFVK